MKDSMYPEIIYFMNTEYPNDKAHSIQITKVLYGLSKYTKITFVCNKITSEITDLRSAIGDKYGYDLGSINFLEIPKNNLRGISFLFTLKKILNLHGKNVVIYTRSYNMAKRFSRYKFLHKKYVFLESHKKNGYYKEDHVEGSRYAEQRKLFERGNSDKRELQKIYRSVDGIVFTSEESRMIATADLGLKNTTSIWHPLTPHSCRSARDRGVVYSGSLAADKLIELLLDALAITRTSLVIDMIGGTPADTRRVMGEAERRGVLGNLRFLDRVPHGDIPEVLCQYRYGLSMMEGLKVADYVECGLIPIIPKIPMYENIFGQDSDIFFQPDDPASLRDILKRIEADHGPDFVQKDILQKYSIDNTAHSILDVVRRSGKYQ